ncbi:hypothetical protein ABGF49_00985 [Helcococcus ovis]|uniref:PASTA domain-containing protein n=1 Tax=Helcococcus ovis TaxID=72026 RepID=A0A4R9C1N4_9FIRM|nr:hypothetical protein [Helcococcus ovis]TFF64572.1 hypothetical protein EQF92_05155 [Helcococcus ovis]TFF65382.1 hypothetical protein EQF91_05900 [Helcococcus ovis]TFF68438.1 hypothetical protein EQF93_02335 [Helcococcus ovis]WNZ00494.1 hypothetical protein EQF90_004345 [Helcococcus ovis]
MPIRKNIAKKIIKIGTNGVKVVRKKIKENPEIAMETLKVASSAVAGIFLGIKNSKDKYVRVPDVRDLLVSDAKKVLSELGFDVHLILDKPNARYANERVEEVTRVVPNSKKLVKGSLIKVYYLDNFGLEESKNLAKVNKKKGNILDKFLKNKK